MVAGDSAKRQTDREAPEELCKHLITLVLPSFRSYS